MPSILNLKFKGNKSFVAFSNLGDAEALTKTWKVCTKVAGYLEQGQRLENLSWRLWHLQNLMVDTDNAKSKREFKKLSKCMSDKLDKEKGRSIEELEAPDFRHNPSSEMIRQRAVEKERSREASQNAKPGTIKRLQFTFSIDQPTPVSAQLVKKPDLKPSPEFNKRPRVGARSITGESHDDNVSMASEDANDKEPPLTQRGRKSQSSSSSDSSPSSSSASSKKSSSSNTSIDSQSLRFPSLFSNDFGPSALLYPSPTLTNRMNYGEATVPHDDDQDGFSIPRPTIELPLDELLSTVDSPRPWSPSFFSTSHSDSQNRVEEENEAPSSNNTSFNPNDHNNAFFLPSIPPYHQNDVIMQSVPISDDSNSDDHTMSFSDLISAHNANNNSLTSTQPLTLHPASFSNSYNQPDTSDDSSASVDSDDEASSEAEMSTAPLPAVSGMPTPTPSTAATASASTPTPTPTPSASLTASAGRGRFGKNATVSGRGASASVARGGRGSTPRPHLTVRTGSSVSTRSGVVLGATPTSLNPALLRNKDEDEGSNSVPATTSGGRGSGGSVTAPVGRTGAGASAMGTGPGGQKAECSNCGATHTPLWRRGLNDELNCNACGLYCKLHKRPRPKTMRNTHGEGRAQAQPRPETVDVMAQCYNCHTTATPLWRKDDEGKTVCNACGLYYKLHGSARPISMKSDVIRKRSRHDARRGGGGALEETPSASPGVSRRASPARESSPTLAPDSSTSTSPPQLNYQYPDNVEYSTQSSELMNALGQDMGQSNSGSDSNNQNSNSFYQNVFGFQFPGPYHPDHLAQFVMQDPLPFPSAEYEGLDPSMSPRSSKRRRMSTDSASEPPSSAVSFTSFDGYSSATSASSHSQRSSVDYAFSGFPASTPTSSYTPFAPASLSGGGMHVFRGSSNTFWHPPMTLASLMSGHDGNNHSTNNNNSPSVYHPPMLPPPEDSPMDYLHPPLLPHDDDALFSAYLHPPMSLPEDGKGQQQHGKGSPNQSPTQGQQGQGQQGQNQSSGQDYMVY